MNENTADTMVHTGPGWLNLRRLSGDGLLVRFGDLTVLCEAASGPASVGMLLDALAEAATVTPDDQRPGERLAGLLDMGELGKGMPGLCAFGPVGDGFAAVVHGNAQVTIAVGGREIRLGRHEQPVVVDEPSPDLPIPRAREPESGPARVAVAEPEPIGRPNILGVHCAKSHFNDPAAAYCSVCGISMAQGDRRSESGPRPQLGTLVLDDGTTYPLVRDLVVGRTPDTDPMVAEGLAGELRLDDPLVSRLHARVELRDWQVTVVDTGSANGTFVLLPGAATWRRLAPDEPAALIPGAVIAFGRRQFRYHSYRNK